MPPIIAAVEAQRHRRRNRRRDARRSSASIEETADDCDAALLDRSIATCTHRAFDLPSRTAPVAAVDDVSFEIRAGETLGLVGESGSGKSVTALSIMRLVQPPGRIAGGSIRFKGRDLLTLAEPDMRAVRGAEIALIFQEPMTALNPVFTIGDQIAEALLVHGRATRREAQGAGRRAARRGPHSRRRGRASTTTRISCRAACGSAC